MAKYRLTWQGDGALDLSQITDVRGLPVFFPKKGAVVVVNELSLKNPLLAKYLEPRGALKAENLAVPAAPPPPPAPAKVKVEPKESVAVVEPPVAIEKSEAEEPKAEEPKAEEEKAEEVKEEVEEVKAEPVLDDPTEVKEEEEAEKTMDKGKSKKKTSKKAKSYRRKKSS